MKALLNMLMVIFIFSGLNLFAQNDDNVPKKMFFDKMNDKFGKALMDGDYNTIASFYTDDAVSLPSYESMWRGKDAILAGNKKDVESGTKYHSFKANTTDFFSSGDITYEIGTYELSFSVPNMATEMNDHGKYLNVWQKQSDGSWKLKADTWNSDVNPMSMNQAGAKSKDDYEK